MNFIKISFKLQIPCSLFVNSRLWLEKCWHSNKKWSVESGYPQYEQRFVWLLLITKSVSLRYPFPIKRRNKIFSWCLGRARALCFFVTSCRNLKRCLPLLDSFHLCCQICRKSLSILFFSSEEFVFRKIFAYLNTETCARVNV